MDLRGFEANVTTGNPVVGATVNVREANLITPNVTSVLATTTTDANGVWEFAGLSDTPKDVDITYTGQHWNYRGLSQVSTSKVYTEDVASGVVPWPLIPNPGFESWIAGVGPVSIGTSATAFADTWLGIVGAGSTGTATREGTTKASASDYSAKLIFSRVAGTMRAYRAMTAEQVSALRGKTVNASMQYRQGVASNTRIFIEDSAGTTYSTAVATTGSFLTANAERTIDSAATKVWVGVEMAASDTAYIDNFAFLIGTEDAVYGPQALGAGSIEDYLIGSRTPDQTVAATSGALSLTNALSMLANRIKALAGTTNWYDAISTSLTGMVAKAGDTMSGNLTFSDSHEGLRLSGGSQMHDAAAVQLEIKAQQGRLSVYDMRDLSEMLILDKDSSAFRFKGIPISISSGTLQTGLNAESVDGATKATLLARANHTGTQLAATISDFSAAVVAASAGVPTGLVAWFGTLAELTAAGSGWARYTAADGLMLIGAGTSGSVTFTQANNYGSSWSHGHTGGSHNHGAAALGVGGATSGPTSNTSVGGGGGSAADGSHTHNIGTMDVTGNTDAGGTVATSTDSWFPPMRAGIWGRKI